MNIKTLISACFYFDRLVVSKRSVTRDDPDSDISHNSFIWFNPNKLKWTLEPLNSGSNAGPSPVLTRDFTTKLSTYGETQSWNGTSAPKLEIVS